LRYFIPKVGYFIFGVEGNSIKFDAMKYTFFFLLGLLFISSCSDGDLQIEALDFDDGTIQFCSEGQDATETTLFFKIDGDEVLILDLQSGLLENEPSTTTISSTIGTNSDLTYRLFTGDVAQDYFCSTIPPADPMVIEEIVATDGLVQIVTTLDTVNRQTKTYNHAITIPELTMVNAAGESLIDQTGVDYGDYTSSLTSSLGQTFANFSEVNGEFCDTSASNLVLTRVLNDEYLILNFPASILVNEATGETPREVAIGETVGFVNGIALAATTTEAACAGYADTDLANKFLANAGTLQVVTVASEPDSNGAVTYTHTLTLVDLVFEDLNAASAGGVDSYVFGAVTTTSN